MGDGSNPILERIEGLRAQWRTFLDLPDARLLHWVIEPDEWKTVETFFALEDEMQDTDVLILQPPGDFIDGESYCTSVIAWLLREFEVARAELAAAGLDCAWELPVSEPGESTVEYLSRFVASFHHHFAPLYRATAIVIAPSHVADPTGFAQWMEEAVRAFSDPEVRLIAFDYRECLKLGNCARSYSGWVATMIADLNMPAAYEEISEAAGIETPAGKFRHTYLQMLNTLGRDIPAAAVLGQAAKAIAESEGWLHLVYCVHYALGGASLGAGDYPAALREYLEADAVAGQLHSDEVDFGRPLQLRARMAAGTTCFSAGSYERAARLFEEAAPIAEETSEAVFVLESWRMAALCRQRAQEVEAAWDDGMRALEAGAEMTPTDREGSTLPFVGTLLLELTREPSHAHHEAGIDARMNELCGPDWQENTVPAGFDPDAVHPLATTDAMAG